MFWSVLFGAIAVSLAFIAVCLYLPIYWTRSITAPNAQYDALDESRKTLAQIFGGAAIILTFAWTFVKDSENLEQARQQIANQAFLESAKLLSDDNNATLRSAGIYSMGRVGSTRVEYHMPVRDSLVSFIHTQSKVHDRNFKTKATKISADVQAAIEILGRRDMKQDDKNRELRLNDLFLSGANFYQLKGFEDASLQNVVLFGANFRGAKLDRIRLDGAQMSDWMGYGYENWKDDIAENSDWIRWERFQYVANFEGASLVSASITGAGLSGAIFMGADLENTNFSRSNLSRADFRNAMNLTKVQWNDEGGWACADVPPLFDEGVKIKLPQC